jgi:hypothetical protein
MAVTSKGQDPLYFGEGLRKERHWWRKRTLELRSAQPRQAAPGIARIKRNPREGRRGDFSGRWEGRLLDLRFLRERDRSRFGVGSSRAVRLGLSYPLLSASSLSTEGESA